MSEFELTVTRFIQAPPETVYRVYTERTREWFTPKPWTTPEVDFDLRPGGRGNVTMQSPEGERHSHKGVFLDVEPGRRLVSTSAFTEDWTPQPGPMNFVSIVTFDPEGEGTRYTARVRHWDADALKRHEAMGFHQGWGIVADQLAELAEAAAAAKAA